MTKPAIRRRESAARLMAERAKRTPQQQLAKLDAILGKGIGAAKERARLHEQMRQSATRKTA